MRGDPNPGESGTSKSRSRRRPDHSAALASPTLVALARLLGQIAARDAINSRSTEPAAPISCVPHEGGGE
jgi:hypothetical protein